MAKTLLFTCPECGEHSVEEVVNCNQASFLITHFDTDSAVVYTNPKLDDNAMFECYRCSSYGHILSDVHELEELKKYMKEV